MRTRVAMAAHIARDARIIIAIIIVVIVVIIIAMPHPDARIIASI
jgi:hypothetical protein